jgi:CheY-like chemotaxis protein
MATEPISIVLAEDDDGHATLIQRNLQRSGVVNGFFRVRDGQEVLDLIRGEGAYVDQPPRGNILLLLDINMPCVDGIEVLRRLKGNARTNAIPIIMLTTTDDPREIERCYQLGCSVYVTKPVEYTAFIEAINRLGLFLQVVRVPPTLGRTEE